MGKQIKSALDELIGSFRFYSESKKGKYSLDTYLDIIGEYTDRIVLECEKENYTFRGGTCTAKNNNAECTYDFTVKIYFQDNDGKEIVKEATRSLPKERFTSETENELTDEKIFEINKSVEER